MAVSAFDSPARGKSTAGAGERKALKLGMHLHARLNSRRNEYNSHTREDETKLCCRNTATKQACKLVQTQSTVHRQVHRLPSELSNIPQRSVVDSILVRIHSACETGYRARYKDGHTRHRRASHEEMIGISRWSKMTPQLLFNCARSEMGPMLMRKTRT